jgi:NADH dehydrogenase
VINKLNNEEFDIPADLVISTCGVQPNKLIQSLSLKKDNYGRILTNRSLQSLDNPNIFALGDCSSIQNVALPSTAQVAMQQSEIVAKNVFTCSKSIDQPNFMELESFRFVPLGEMLTLGKKDASIYSLGGLVELDGPLAAISRRLVYAARMPTNSQKTSALINSGISAFKNLLSRK